MKVSINDLSVCLSVCLLFVCVWHSSTYIQLSGNTVLVHGGGGRDLTLLATSLAQVLLDPHCRTVTGYVVIIFNPVIYMRAYT